MKSRTRRPAAGSGPSSLAGTARSTTTLRSAATTPGRGSRAIRSRRGYGSPSGVARSWASSGSSSTGRRRRSSRWSSRSTPRAGHRALARRDRGRGRAADGARQVKATPVARNALALRFFHRLGFDTLGHVDVLLDLERPKEYWTARASLAEREFELELLDELEPVPVGVEHVDDPHLVVDLEHGADVDALGAQAVGLGLDVRRRRRSRPAPPAAARLPRARSRISPCSRLAQSSSA